MAAYRFHEIIFDLLVLFYSLVLSEWEMTEFATATTVLSSLDIVVNCVILGRNWYDVCTRARKKPDIIITVFYFTVINQNFRPHHRVWFPSCTYTSLVSFMYIYIFDFLLNFLLTSFLTTMTSTK
jgi:hypothetical protein